MELERRESWDIIVDCDEVHRIICESRNYPPSVTGLRVEFNAIADRGLSTERIVKGFVILNDGDYEMVIKSMVFTNL
jgi:hypothetical protein